MENPIKMDDLGVTPIFGNITNMISENVSNAGGESPHLKTTDLPANSSPRKVGILDDSQALYKMLFPMSELQSIQVRNFDEWKLYTVYLYKSIYNV